MKANIQAGLTLSRLDMSPSLSLFIQHSVCTVIMRSCVIYSYFESSNWDILSRCLSVAPKQNCLLGEQRMRACQYSAISPSNPARRERIKQTSAAVSPASRLYSDLIYFVLSDWTHIHNGENRERRQNIWLGLRLSRLFRTPIGGS